MQPTFERLQQVLDAVADGYYHLDRDWCFVEVNAACARHLHRPAESLIGKNIWRETGLGPGNSVYDRFHEVASSGRTTRFETESTLLPGEWFELTLLPGDDGLVVLFRTITDRKRAEAAAARAAEQRELALEIAHLGMWEFDEDGEVLRFDARSRDVLGITEREQATTLSDFLAAIHPDDRAVVRADVGRALDPTGDGEYVSEHRVVHPDGSVRWVVARGRMMAGPPRAEGTRRGVGTLMDVTAERLAQEAVRESETRFRAVFDHLPDAVFLTVPEGRILAANAAACAMFQMTEEEIRARGREGLIDVHDPRADALLKERRRTGSVTNWEHDFIRKNGERFPGEASSVVLPGNDARAFVVVRDISARKRADAAVRTTEARLREQAAELQAVLDALPVAVFITRDPEARYMQGNRFTEALLRVAPRTNLSKSAPEREQPPFRMLRNGREVPTEMMPVQTALRTGRELRDYQFDLVFEDGAVASLLGNAAPLTDSEGHVRGAVGAFVDVTRLKETEVALSRANAGLAEADRRKDEFIAILSHELRNPLAPIKYALPILGRERLTEAGGRAAQVIDRQVDHLTRLVDDLLDVSRITRGKIDLRREHITLGSAVTAAVEAASPAIAAARHTLELAVSEEPIWLHADVARIAQVITNLLNNSAKYTPRGGRIVLEAGREARQAVVRVTDTGMGIPPEALPGVFDMFRQVNRPDKSQGGLGIGLALVRRLVEMHGGSIEAHSEGLGKGSQFTVRLPIAGDTAVPAVADSAESVRAAGHRLKVLVVDDNQDLVEMLAMLVERAGHDVRKALDGRSAVSAALAYRPDVVFLDLGLPIMGGLDVARELRRHAETARAWLVALTGWGQAEDRRQTEEAGFDDHLTKPADPERLERLLEQLAAAPRR